MRPSLNWRDIERMAAINLALVHVGLGTSIIAGGSRRFPPPTYDVLLDASNGHVWPYGLTFVIVGLALTSPDPRVLFFAHWAGVISMNIFAALFFLAMVKNEAAAATAWWAYFGLGTIHGFNIALMLVRRKQHLYPELEKDGRGEV